MEMERPNCPMCQGSRRRLLYDFSPFGVAECEQCRFHYLYPRPTQEEMLRIYSDEGYYHDENQPGYEDYQAQQKSLGMTFRRFLGQLSKVGASGGELLELGCGLGYFLKEASVHHSALFGTDYSPGALSSIQSGLATLYEGGIDAVPAKRKFDRIVLIQVLEHVYEPLQLLGQLRERLRPEGSVAVAVPNWNSPLRLLLGKRWPSFKVPEHLMYFDRESLRQAFLRNGFRNVKEISYPHAFPLSLLFGKINIKLPQSLGEICVWVPTTCVAMVGFR